MASFDELLAMAMEQERWEKGVESVANLIKVFPRGMAEEVRIDSWDYSRICMERKDSGTETEAERMERKYTKEIWEQAFARIAWLDYQVPKQPWEREENQHGR